MRRARSGRDARVVLSQTQRRHGGAASYRCRHLGQGGLRLGCECRSVEPPPAQGDRRGHSLGQGLYGRATVGEHRSELLLFGHARGRADRPFGIALQRVAARSAARRRRFFRCHGLRGAGGHGRRIFGDAQARRQHLLH